MRILIPVLGFGNAGGYRVLSKLADELIDLGHEVEFLTPRESKDPYFPTKASINWIFENGNTKSTREYLLLSQNALKINQKITAGLKKLGNSFDVILANHSLTILPIKRAGFLYKTLYYVQAYEPELYEFSKSVKNKILKYFSEQSYKTKVLTIVNADIYKNYKLLRSSRVLYPGIDFNFFYSKKKEDLKNKKIIIGTIGRKEINKGTNYILEAFYKLIKILPNIELHIAFGSKDFQAHPNIICIYPNGDKELGDYYRSLDYYISAGYYQQGAFHYPVVEAMACGIPIISTNYYPVNTLNCWLTEIKNSDDIVSKFELAVNNPEERKSKVLNGLTDVKQFEWKNAAKKLEAYLLELFKNNNSILH